MTPHDAVTAVELSPAAENVDVAAAVLADEAVDQREMCDGERISGSTADAVGCGSVHATDSVNSAPVAESDCLLPATNTKSSTITDANHVTSHTVTLSSSSVRSVPEDVVCIDSDVSALPAATGVRSDEQVRLAASSPVINVDDDDDVVVDERESGVSKRTKETVAGVWKSRPRGALKSVVNRAVAHVSALRGPDSVSPVSINSDSSTSVAVALSSSAATTSVPPRTTHSAVVGSRSQVTRAPVHGRTTDATVPLSDVPMARVIGQIISMRRSSPHVRPPAHRATTTATRSTTAASSSVVQAHAVQLSAARVSATTASSSNVSSAAKGRGSASSRSTRGRGIRRGPRPRHVAVLRPEDLYEISSQIVAEVLQRNQQASEMDVITCDDDDDDGDEGVVEVDMSGGDSSSGDVMIVDEPAANAMTADVPSLTSRPTADSHHPRASSKTTPGSHSSAAAAVSTQKKLLIPSSSRSLLTQPSHRQHVNQSDDVTVVDAAEETDDADVVCCDEDSRDAFPAGPVDVAAPIPAPGNRVSAAAAAPGDDDVLICDTPAPDKNVIILD